MSINSEEETQASLEVIRWLESYLTAKPHIRLDAKIIALAKFTAEDFFQQCLLNTALLACIKTLLKDRSLPSLLLEVKDLMATNFDSISLEAVHLTSFKDFL